MLTSSVALLQVHTLWFRYREATLFEAKRTSSTLWSFRIQRYNIYVVELYFSCLRLSWIM